MKALLPLLLLVPLCSVKRTKTDNYPSFVLENEYLRIIVFPDLGGRIGYLIYKPTGKNLVYWDLSLDSEYRGLGGALDDRASSFAPYKSELLKSTPEEVKLRLTWEDDFVVSKTLTFYPDKPLIQVDYHYINATQKDIGEYRLMIRNFFIPSGGPVSETDMYNIPTTKAVRAFHFKTLRPAYPELRGKFKTQIGAPWQALISTIDRVAIVLIHNDDALKWIYWWKQGVAYPTFEWVYKDLPAGMERRTGLIIAVVGGIESVIDATRFYVASLRKETEKLHLTFIPIWWGLTDVRVESFLFTPDGRTAVPLPTIKLGDVNLNQKAVATLSVPPRKDLILHQKFFTGSTLLGQYYEPLHPPAVEKVWARKIVFPVRSEVTQVAGWRKVEPPTVRPTAKEKKRGYIVYLDEFAPSDDRWGREVSKITLDLGLGEYESFSVAFRAFKEIGTVEVQTRAPFGLTTRLEELVNVGDESIGKPYLPGKKLIPVAEFTPQPGRTLHLWFTIQPLDSSGKHRATIDLIPERAKTKSIRLLIRVLRVPYPERPLVQSEVEHHFQSLPGVRTKDGWVIPVVKKYITDLAQHRTTTFQMYGRLPGVEKRGTEYDFSSYEPVLNEAIRAGLMRFSTNASALKPENTEMIQYFRDFYQFVRGRGFPRASCFAKTLDEQPPSRYPLLTRLAGIMKSLGWRPFSTFSDQLAVPEYMKILNPVIDMFQGGFTAPEDYRARLNEGLIDPTDEIWIYAGWGAVWIAYTSELGRFWNTAYLNLDGFHTHVYFRSKLIDAVVFPTKEGPIGSPAWEGIRDGLESANYYRLLQYYITRLKSSGDPRAVRKALSAEKELSRVAGTSSDSILRFKIIPRGIHSRFLRLSQPSIRKYRLAKLRVLELLEEFQPFLDRMPAELYWGDLPVALASKPLMTILYSTTKEQALYLEERLENEFGLSFPLLSESELSSAATPVLLHLSVKGEASLLLESIMKTMKAGLGTKSYVVRDVANPYLKDGRFILLHAVGRDELKLGIDNFIRLLTPYNTRHLILSLSAN